MSGPLSMSVPSTEESFSEKSFYLDEFHEKTLLFALAPGATAGADWNEFLATLRELVRAEARLVLVVCEEEVARRLDRKLRRLAAASLSAPLFPIRGVEATRPSIVVETARPEPDLPVLLRLWSLLRTGPVAVIRFPDQDWNGLARYAARLAARLKVYKLVLVDPEGGVRQREVLSFLDESVLSTLLTAGEAEWVGLGHRRALIEIVREALLAGVPSVNLCDLGGLARELYTYEGSGTLFTLEDYCRVERLGIDDFREVERLLERGQREGFLKLRTPEEIGTLLLTGFGATIGSGHLAGVGALLTEPYREERVGEIVGLYTISRFKGEGVGARLLTRLLEEARSQGLRSVFACTTAENAMNFFLRHSFRRVAPEDVPRAKWREYDPDRLRRVAVFWRDLEPEKAEP
jgi:N-acetylglutamate synthase-like GNAT family acetyltransferase